MKKMKLLLLAIALVSANIANAITVNQSAGNGGSASDYTLTNTSLTGNTGKSAGGGPLGNDTPRNINNANHFGHNDWILADKSDDNTSGTGELSFTSPATFTTGTSGSFTLTSLSAFNAYEDIIISLKAGNNYAVFEVDPNNITSATFDWGISRNISHASIFYRPGTTPPVTTPDAGSTLALMGIALAGLGALKRRK